MRLTSQPSSTENNSNSTKLFDDSFFICIFLKIIKICSYRESADFDCVSQKYKIEINYIKYKYEITIDTVGVSCLLK